MGPYHSVLSLGLTKADSREVNFANRRNFVWHPTCRVKAQVPLQGHSDVSHRIRPRAAFPGFDDHFAGSFTHGRVYRWYERHIGERAGSQVKDLCWHPTCRVKAQVQFQEHSDVSHRIRPRAAFPGFNDSFPPTHPIVYVASLAHGRTGIFPWVFFARRF